MLRRLTHEDKDLLRQAYYWDSLTPRWFREADAVFNTGSADDLIAQLEDRVKWFIGIFDPHLQAVIIVENHGDGQFEGHLMARRDADVQLIALTIDHLLHDLLTFGLTEAFVWVAEKHRGMRKLCANIQFQPDGVSMYKGAYHGRVIKWLRYSITRERLLMAEAA